MDFTSLEYWIYLLNKWKELGLIAPFLLAMIESFIPALPLAAIIAFNVSVYGGILGFLFSYLGTTVGSLMVFILTRLYLKRWLDKFIQKRKKVKKFLDWIAKSDPITLFILTAIPFTPSSFINVGYGLSDFSKRKFMITIILSKSIMTMFLSFFGKALSKTMDNPLFLVLAISILLVLFFTASKMKKHFGFDEIEKGDK